MRNDEGKHESDASRSSTLGDLEVEQARIMIAVGRDRARVRRLGTIVPVLWCLYIVGFVIGSILVTRLKQMTPTQSALLRGYEIVLVLILIVAIVCTVSLYVRRQALGQRQLLASLAGIEKALLELGRKLQ